MTTYSRHKIGFVCPVQPEFIEEFKPMIQSQVEAQRNALCDARFGPGNWRTDVADYDGWRINERRGSWKDEETGEVIEYTEHYVNARVWIYGNDETDAGIEIPTSELT